MKSILTHRKGMSFTANIRDLTVAIDQPEGAGGSNTGPNPKELLLTSLSACSAMDVVSLLRKYEIELVDLVVTAKAETRAAHPRIFEQIEIVYEMKLGQFDRTTQLEKALQSVVLSMTRYCGVSAMITPASPVFYTVVIDGAIEYRDQAHFPEEELLPSSPKG